MCGHVSVVQGEPGGDIAELGSCDAVQSISRGEIGGARWRDGVRQEYV